MIHDKSRILVAVLLLFLVMAFPAAAATYTEDSFYYEIEDNAIVITGYFGDDDVINVPSVIAGYPVNRIAEKAFADAKASVINLPDTIMDVESEAFPSGAVVNYNVMTVIVEPASTDPGQENGGQGDGTGETESLQEPTSPAPSQEPTSPASSQEPTSPAHSQEPTSPAPSQEPTSPASSQGDTSPASSRDSSSDAFSQGTEKTRSTGENQIKPDGSASSAGISVRGDAYSSGRSGDTGSGSPEPEGLQSDEGSFSHDEGFSDIDAGDATEPAQGAAAESDTPGEGQDLSSSAGSDELSEATPASSQTAPKEQPAAPAGVITAICAAVVLCLFLIFFIRRKKKKEQKNGK